ncbi:hypothetical protein L6452_18077 [Arctium lappa]|uniref:Uncharacterized protein n=1 Tax=Arctium lappa TaxID=4217 RepID=A0ACB9C546_ARCLA|nr:hypothetical protein L6452_18077 [Arctium lappa]
MVVDSVVERELSPVDLGGASRRRRERGLVRRGSCLNIYYFLSIRTYHDGIKVEGGWDSSEKGMVVESPERDGEFVGGGLGHASRFQEETEVLLTLSKAVGGNIVL